MYDHRNTMVDLGNSFCYSGQQQQQVRIFNSKTYMVLSCITFKVECMTAIYVLCVRPSCGMVLRILQPLIFLNGKGKIAVVKV